MVQTTRYKDIFVHLKSNGILAYSPSQKGGECTEPYTVVKDMGASKMAGYSTTVNLYELLCYVPKNSFTKLDEYVSKVEKVMEKLKPMIMPTYYKTPSYYDDAIKGHMVSVQYQNYKKIG